MDQNVIANFKKLYMKKIFEMLFEETVEKGLTEREDVINFWKHTFDMRLAVLLIARSWKGVTRKTLVAAWRKLCPEMTAEVEAQMAGLTLNDPDEEEPDIQATIETARKVGMELKETDLQEVYDYEEAWVTDPSVSQLQEMLAEEEGPEEIDPADEDMEEEPPVDSKSVKEGLAAWEKAKSLLFQHHPDALGLDEAINKIDAKGMMHFRKLLRERQVQVTMDRFVSRPAPAPAPSGSVAEPSNTGPSGVLVKTPE
jgi:hypothetical protein